VALLPPGAGVAGRPLPAGIAVPAPPAPVALPAPAEDPAAPRAAGRRRRVPQSERREQLLDVALDILGEQGFGAISMEAVARRAGVNRVVVYRSFANLPVLLATLMHREDQRVRGTLRGLIPQDAVERPPAEILLGALATLLTAVAEQPGTWRLALLRPESAPRALQKIVNRRRASLARRIEALVRFALRELRPDPPRHEVEAIARMLLTIGEEEGRLALDDPDYPPERLLRASWDLLSAMQLPAAPGTEP
jgi:AcrR family transcriptional regulator